MHTHAYTLPHCLMRTKTHTHTHTHTHTKQYLDGICMCGSPGVPVHRSGDNRYPPRASPGPYGLSPLTSLLLQYRTDCQCVC